MLTFLSLLGQINSYRTFKCCFSKSTKFFYGKLYFLEMAIEKALHMGIKAHSAGQYKEADRIFTAILKAQPQNPDANHNMGLLAISVGNMEEALPFLKSAIEASPAVAQFWISYIGALIKLEKFADARVVLNQAKKNGAKGVIFEGLAKKLRPNRDDDKGQDPAQIQLKKINSLYRKGEFKKTLEQISKLLTVFPNSVVLYNIQGASNAGLKNFEAAIANYERAIALNPNYAAAHNNMGNVLKDIGQLEKAVEAYGKAIELKPHDAEVLNNLGAALKDQGKFKESILTYERAIEINPDDPEIHTNMGHTQKEQGSLQLALNSYKKAVSLKPNFLEGYYNISVLLEEMGRLNEAINSYKKVIEIYPDDAEVHNNMANFLKNHGKQDEAIKGYKQALFLNPSFAEAFSNMATAIQDKGNHEEAIKLYEKAVSINPNFAKAYLNMGLAFQALGGLEEAIKAYRHALSIKPQYPDAHNNIGVSLIEQGLHAEAIDAFNMALTLNPNHVEALINKANVQKVQGNLEGAIELYIEALLLNPEDYRIWNNIFDPLFTIKKRIPSLDIIFSRLCAQSKSKYVKIEKSLLNYRLHLGEENVEEAFDEALSYLPHGENTIIDNPQLGNQPKVSRSDVPDKTIALVHFGRSGTGLLHSLIDNHPEVSTLPSIYFSEYFDHAQWTKIVASGWGEMVERFIGVYEVLFDASARSPIKTKSGLVNYFLGKKEGMANVGEYQDEVLKVDKKLFSDELKRLLNSQSSVDASKFFELVHYAYNKAINDIRQKKLIFYHIHNPDTYAQLNFIRSVPNANWIVMVREPVQSCESWIRGSYEINDYSGCCARIGTMLFELDKIVYQKQNSVGVRLEDLKERPQETISALCKWMDIKESESLYEMTAQGKRWWGDPSSPDFEKDGMDPFGQTSIKRKAGSIFSVDDQFILSTLFYPFSVQFGYIKENEKQFIVDLQNIRHMLDNMFDFEKTIAERTAVDCQSFKKLGSFLYLRKALIERWEILNKRQTYPNIINPLVLHGG